MNSVAREIISVSFLHFAVSAIIAIPAAREGAVFLIASAAFPRTLIEPIARNIWGN